MTSATASGAAVAYDALAADYDALTADYDHATWLRRIEALARERGLTGRRVLDVACGTGKSLEPLLERGYDGAGTDVSEAMLGVARRRLGPGVPLIGADMRALPRLGCFDLVTCLDDAVNYLTEDEDLRGALRSMRRQLRAGGRLVLDVNSLATYRTTFASTWVRAVGASFIAWEGHASVDAPSGGRVGATVTAFSRTPDGSWRRAVSVHEQRHWPIDRLRRAADEGGLKVLDVLGQRPGAMVEADFDELEHHKALLVLGPA